MYDIERFIIAQEKTNDWESALQELKAGKKETHWMWYMFPQIEGLSLSNKGAYYSLEGLDEAKAYFANELLRERLLLLTTIVKNHSESLTLEEIFDYPDSEKFISCMTLFKHATGHDLFEETLDAYGEEEDPFTLDFLR